MLCQNCQSAPASVHLLEMIGRKVARQSHLCQRCSEAGAVASAPARGRRTARWPKGSVNPYAASAGILRPDPRWSVGLN